MRTFFVCLAIGAAATTSTTLAADIAITDDWDLPPLTVIEAPIDYGSTGAYVAARLASAFTPDTDFDLGIVNTNIINEYNHLGIGGALATGYSFNWGNNISLRTEIEGGVTLHEVESHTLTAINTTLSDPQAFGRTEIFYGLINAALDVDVGQGFKPFLSAGAGFANVSFDDHGVTLNPPIGPVGPLGPGDVTALDDSDSGLAWQIGGGVGYALGERTTLETGYRYFEVSNIDLTAVDGTTSKVPIKQHQVQFGVRYGF